MSAPRFCAKTNEGHTIKVLIDTLQFYLKKNGFFTFSPSGIYMNTLDVSKKAQVVMNLPKENFVRYDCPQAFSFNVNLININMMLKQVRKKDRMVIALEGDNLTFKVISGTNSDDTWKVKVVIQMLDILPCEIKETYDISVVSTSSNFQKICRGMNNINKDKMTISCDRPGQLNLNCIGDDVMSREGCIGDNDIDESEPIEEKFERYSQTFNTQYIVRLCKLVALINSVKIFISKDEPICFKMAVSGLGEISFYIKSIEKLEAENSASKA
jgi:proliferating cell nuclear antigen PCNA